MLVFAGHVPNSPLLMPAISGDRVGAISKTQGALKLLAEELYATHPEVIVIISDHPTQFTEAFSIAVADPYRCDLSQVGDLGYHQTYHPDFALIDALQRSLRQQGEAVTMSTDDHLNFAAAVPLHWLTSHLPKIKIVPICPSQLEPKAHFTFGQSLKHTLVESKKRIAVISAGDLSHTLADFAPHGLHADGPIYDETLLTNLEEHNVVGLLQINESLRHNAAESAYTKLLILLGVLDQLPVTTNIMSYESPFGVGLAVVHFTIE